MIQFVPVTMALREEHDRILAEQDRLYGNHTCNISFATDCLWSHYYRNEIAFTHGCMIVKWQAPYWTSFGCPLGGGDRKKAVEELMEYWEQTGMEPTLYLNTEEQAQFLNENFPDVFDIIPNRDGYDYVYRMEDLRDLPGKHYHGKRGHIAKFTASNDWHYETMTASNIPDCLTFLDRWSGTRLSSAEMPDREEFEAESTFTRRCLENLSKLNMRGGVLYANGRIVAFTIGEKVNDDVMLVHVEKAEAAMEGAYPMINQQFVQHECQDVKYINREDDAGVPGLRRAKLSYRPAFLNQKWRATKSDITRARPVEREDIIRVWQEAFGDDREYIEFYLDRRFDAGNMPVVREDGRIVSMLSLLPAQLILPDRNGTKQEPLEVLYVYAVATAPEYRRRGYAERLIRHVRERQGKPLVLCPAGEKLRSYYERMGFVPLAQPYRRVLTPAECGPAVEQAVVTPSAASGLRVTELLPGDAAKYLALRDEKLARPGYLAWDKDALSYAIGENILCGGNTLLVQDGTVKTKGILMLRPVCGEPDARRIVETTFSEAELPAVLAAVDAGGQRLIPGERFVIESEGGLILWPEQMRPEAPMEDGYLGLNLG